MNIIAWYFYKIWNLLTDPVPKAKYFWLKPGTGKLPSTEMVNPRTSGAPIWHPVWTERSGNNVLIWMDCDC